MREIRRLAFLHIPQEWEPEGIVQEVKKLGFTDIYMFVRFGDNEPGVDIGMIPLPVAMEVGRLAEREGMGVLANSGYIKYHEQIIQSHPERRMVLRRSLGRDPDRVVSEHVSGEETWLCPFQEPTKEQYKKDLRKLAQIPGLRYVYLNDEGFLSKGGETACYCDYCQGRFAERFGQRPPYEIDWENPLWRAWIKWRFEQWTAVHAEFREAVKAVRPEVGVGVTCGCTVELLGFKPWIHAIDLGAMSSVMDTMNTGIYHGTGSGALKYTPSFVSVLEVASIFVGALQGKPFRLAVQAFCPGTSVFPLTRKDGHYIGILPYAVGVDFVAPWCYETLKALPSQYEGYMETFRLDPYLKETEPEVSCSLFHSIQSEVWRYHDVDYDVLSVRPFGQMLRDEGLPYAYILDSSLKETDLKRRGPLVLPHVCCLSEAQRDQLTSYLETGGAILATSDLGMLDEGGKSVSEGLSRQWRVTLSGKALEGRYRLSFKAACPIAGDITDPVLVDNPYEVTATTGEVWATLVDAGGKDTGIPGLVYARVGKGKFVYLAGDPAPEHREPGVIALSKRPNHTRRLVRKLIRFLEIRPPAIEVEDFPPVTAYQRLRPWDRRGINTFQFFSQVGSRYALAIIASYMGEEGDIHVRFRIPEGKRPARIFNGLTGASCMEKARIEGDSVRLTLRVTEPDAVVPVVAEWEAA